ncbi:MAG TPA: bifunctional phosphoribosylaminoimidazolecarboxamide formyltransferase/IMP cyclohydrolase [Clostridia bacterium]|nr:bifunctional phosphoribosylaminoimidazolecarboxamide formyltransferase/IMP cyclohydrolase [Clostridia bacterium]
MARIQRAILSVTDKTGLVEFARRLAGMGVELISTGGTAKLLREAGIVVKDISDLTGFPEMLDGRVKTLHPKVHGGILHIRENAAHRAAIAEHGIEPIDMVVVNLYAFEKTAAKPGAHFEEIVENIDIGGPSMVRSAAKNFQDVAIVTSPSDYAAIADELATREGTLSLATKWRLAQKAFATTAAYDSAIASALEKVSCDGKAFDITGLNAETLPPTMRISATKVMDLRYGENPHQKAALYSDGSTTGIANGKQLQGKELSYNNIVDLQAAWDLACEFDEPFCAIIKHTNPCGSAVGKDIAEAFLRAFECDPVSAFGGVIALNRPVDGATAEAIAGLRHNGQSLFIECIIAPLFDQAARERFAKRKDLRLLEIQNAPQKWIVKTVSGGLLVQDSDLHKLNPATLKVVTERQPTEAEMRDLLFAWKVCKHVKSNAILYAKEGRGIGVGAGQMSRVDSARIGASKAVLPMEGCVAASDAFFPFPDGVEVIAAAGATAIIQPGGSKADPQVIATANNLGLAMVLTGVRHFRH